MSQGWSLLGKVLVGGRYFAVVTVVCTLLAAFFLYIAGALSFITLLIDSLQAGHWSLKVSKEAAIGILNVIDLFLIAIGLQIMSTGVYLIFLDGNLPVPAGLKVTNFRELKFSMVKMVGIVLFILFLEHAFKLGPGKPIMYLGVGIAAVIIAFAWAIGHEQLNR